MSLALLMCAVVEAHVVPFRFVVPDGVGTRADGGVVAVQWTAGPDPTGAAEFSLYASRNGTAPFAVPRYDATIDATSRVPVDGVRGWDARALPPGCYQPFAQMDDQIEGTTWRRAEGLIAIGLADGGNAPPAVWVSSVADTPVADGGLTLSFDVDDPDDPSTVAIDWVAPDGGAGRVGTVAFAKGRSPGRFTVPLAALPVGVAVGLRFEVTGADGQRCSAYWNGQATGVAAPPDAGVPPDPADGGDTKGQPAGCGCSAGPPWLALGALLTAGGCGRRRRA